MAYIKLNEVEIVDSSIDSNILIEENNEIKRMPVENLTMSQVHADWNETDPTEPSFIVNKPESLGGGGKVVVFSGQSGIFTDSDGNKMSSYRLIDEWNEGSILKFLVKEQPGNQSTYNSSNIIAIRPVYFYNSLSTNNELDSVKFSYYDFNTQSISEDQII